MSRILARHALVLCALASASLAAAGESVHRVRPGESASSIAHSYYGDFELAGLLLEYNGKPGTVIRVGETLRIPKCEEHVVRAGDTWSALAQRYLGRPKAWTAVALLNGLLPGQPLQVGQRIVFPVVLEHSLARGETLAVLAQRFYGDSRLGTALQRFNQIEDPRRLSVGETIEIPLIGFRNAQKNRVASTRPEKPAAAPSESVAKKAVEPESSEPESSKPESSKPDPQPEPAPSEPQPRFTAELGSVRRAVAQGQFERSRERLDELRSTVSREGTPVDKAELWRLLATVYVAFDEEHEACEAYRSLVALPVKQTIDPDLVSPKVRETFARCGSR